MIDHNPNMAIQLSEAGPSRPPSPSPNRYALTHDLKAHRRAVTCLRFSPDGEVLVSGGADGYLHFWDPSTGEHQRSLRAHRAGINDLTISPDSLYVATASDDGTINVNPLRPAPSSVRHPPPLRQLKAHTAPVLSVAFSPKSNLLVSGSFDESAIIWNVKGGSPLRVLPAHSEAVWTVGWDNEGGMVLTGSTDGLIRLWDAHSGQCLKTFDNDTNSPVSSASFTPSSSYLLAATLSSTLRVYNITNGKVLKTLRAPTDFVSEKFPCPALCFPAARETHANGDFMALDVDETSSAKAAPSRKASKEAWVASGSENGRTVIWELSSRQVLQVLEAQNCNTPIVAVAVSPDGRCIATGTLEPDKTIRLWSIRS